MPFDVEEYAEERNGFVRLLACLSFIFGLICVVPICYFAFKGEYKLLGAWFISTLIWCMIIYPLCNLFSLILLPLLKFAKGRNSSLIITFICTSFNAIVNLLASYFAYNTMVNYVIGYIGENNINTTNVIMTFIIAYSIACSGFQHLADKEKESESAQTLSFFMRLAFSILLVANCLGFFGVFINLSILFAFGFLGYVGFVCLKAYRELALYEV